MGVKFKSVLVLAKDKFNHFTDIEKDYLKNALIIIVLFFLGSFSFMSVVMSKQIERKSLSINFANPENVNPEIVQRVKELAGGYPIEKMAKYIASEDEDVAAFMISIAKKESNWGMRTPKLNGKECYNYWGFRQKRERMGSGGHTCFNNPRDAVKSVAARIDDLIKKEIDTPEEMVAWKCGYSCDGHNPQSVQKWINDVKLYYNKF